MLRVALVGPAGVGKSTLAYAFSKYLERRGVSVGLVNLDAEAKRLPYKPTADARKEKEVQRALARVKADVVLLDTRYGLEDVLYGPGRAELSKACGAVVLLADARTMGEWESLDLFDRAARLGGEALGVPVVAVLNKSDLARSARPKKVQALEAHERAHVRDGAVRVSAVTREGFEELWRALRAS